MPDPLDYFNPNASPDADEKPESITPARVAIPAQFEVELTKSCEHAAVRAISTALQKHRVPHHISGGLEAAGRELRLYVRAIDWERATEIAARIFATRKKLKRQQRQQESVQRSSWPDPFQFGSFLR